MTDQSPFESREINPVKIEPTGRNQPIKPAPEQNKTSFFTNTKEKVSSFIKYRRLKVKEYFGQLNQEEFDELLSVDFQDQLKDNPPIEGVFSAEKELARIKSLPKEQKREALTSFKENLAKQQEALANCRVFIERYIEFNNDVPREKLVVLIEQFGTQYGFTDAQKQTAEKLIDGYYENRRRVLEIRKQYPDNVALVSELSGVEFDSTAQFDVSIGPMSIDIVTDGLNTNRIYRRSKDVMTKHPHGGFASLSRHKQSVLFTVINKSKPLEGRLFRKAALIHEHEHEKNRLFRASFDRQVDPHEKNAILTQYEYENEPETKKELLEAYFRLRRQEAFQRVKDELISIKKDKTPFPFRYEIFFMKGSPYDYLAPLRNWDRKKNDPLWKETTKRILVDDYERILRQAFSAFHSLEKKGKYTTDETITMFTDKPLPDWPKTARRLLDHKNSVL